MGSVGAGPVLALQHRADVARADLGVKRHFDDELTALAAQPQRAARHPSDDRAGDRRGDLDLLAEEFDALRFDAFALTPVDRPQGSRYRAFERLFERSGAGAYRHGDQRYLRRRWCPVGRARRDRTSVVEGKSVSGRVDLGGWRLIK